MPDQVRHDECLASITIGQTLGAWHCPASAPNAPPATGERRRLSSAMSPSFSSRAGGAAAGLYPRWISASFKAWMTLLIKLSSVSESAFTSPEALLR